MKVLNEVYLDNSATTRVCECAVNKMVNMMLENYGNPSSLHTKGFEAEKELKSAREKVASVIKADPSEIIFTSGGTEANNMAIFGAAASRSRFGKNIVTTAIEHHSVISIIKKLQKDGFSATFIKPDEYGHITTEKIIDSVTADTILVSIMAVNNEVGTVIRLQDAAKEIKKLAPHALLHVDAVQAYGKIPIDVSMGNIDMLSVSAHKIHGPKGVGALYISKKVKLPPFILGGGQEKGLRSGTEAMPAICGFGCAAENIQNISKELLSMKEKSDLCKKHLSEIDGIVINSPDDALPYIVNFSVPGIRSEVLLHYLSSYGIYVSAGSACAGKEKSHVLTAMGLSKDRIDSSIRVSFSNETSFDDIKFFSEKLTEGCKTLIKTEPWRKKAHE